MNIKIITFSIKQIIVWDSEVLSLSLCGQVLGGPGYTTPLAPKNRAD
jgi:hypothetical protein